VPAPPLPNERVRDIHRLLAEGLTFREIVKALDVGIGTVSRYAKELPEEPATAPAGDGPPPLPDPVDLPYTPYAIDTPGAWLIVSDLHLPYHDRATVEAAVGEARRRNVAGVLLNGDILDSHEISSHDQDPRAKRYREEVEVGKRFLAWLRGQLPTARIVYKSGNHEDRLERYILARAPALFELENVDLPGLLHLADFGVDHVGDRRVITLGKLNVIHGHEYRGGVSTPVNPARGLYLKARSVAICGHWHKTSEHHERNIRGQAEAAWSVGCACALAPRYNPLSNWNHGFALVDVESDGTFSVSNRRVMGGKAV